MTIKQKSQDMIVLLGRILISQIFIISGIDKILNFVSTAAQMAQAGVSYSESLLVIAIILELAGGVMILLGWKARWGAFFIFVFVALVTYTFHSFWTYEPLQAINQMHHFMKNLAMMGGALYIMAYGAGKYSLDGRRK